MTVYYLCVAYVLGRSVYICGCKDKIRLYHHAGLSPSRSANRLVGSARCTFTAHHGHPDVICRPNVTGASMVKPAIEIGCVLVVYVDVIVVHA